MILVTIKIDVRSTKQKELAQTLSALAGRVRKEAGCVSSTFYCDVEKENALCVLEEWATQSDLNTLAAHFVSFLSQRPSKSSLLR